VYPCLLLQLSLPCRPRYSTLLVCAIAGSIILRLSSSRPRLATSPIDPYFPLQFYYEPTNHSSTRSRPMPEARSALDNILGIRSDDQTAESLTMPHAKAQCGNYGARFGSVATLDALVAEWLFALQPSATDTIWTQNECPSSPRIHLTIISSTSRPRR
jgi:hypothetical protein